MTAQYRRKPTLVDVRQWTGENAAVLDMFADGGIAWGHFEVDSDRPHGVFNSDADRYEQFGFGDWIVRDDNGSLSVVTNQVFRDYYEAVS